MGESVKHRGSMTREQERGVYRSAWQQKQARWNADREAMIEEHTTECPFCRRPLSPLLLGMDGQPWAGGDVFIRRRTSCGCEQEKEAIAVQVEQEERAQKERRRAAWAWALKKAGLVGWLATASLDSYRVSNQEQSGRLQLCRDYTRDLLHSDLGEKPWLVLYGQYGTGKTHLAASVIREALGNGWHGCYFRPWLSYLRRLMDSFGEDSEENTADVARELAAGKLVAIDDIDNDRANTSKSGFAETELFRALDERYRAGRPTILTFNRHPLEMVPWFGVAGVDRVMHYSYAVVQFAGTSYRSGQNWGAEEE